MRSAAKGHFDTPKVTLRVLSNSSVDRHQSAARQDRHIDVDAPAKLEPLNLKRRQESPVEAIRVIRPLPSSALEGESPNISLSNGHGQ